MPRVDARAVNQEQRIEQGEKTGTLTAHEAKRLERQQAHIAKAEGKERYSPEVQRREAFLGLAGDRYDAGEFKAPVNTFDLIVLSQAAMASTQLESNITRIEEQLRDRSEDQALRNQLADAEQKKLHWQAMSPQFQLFCFILLL